MNEPTICKKCRHCKLHPNGKRVKRARCYADWPKTMNFVNGEMIPRSESCSAKNPNGRCTRYEQRKSYWEVILDRIHPIAESL